MSKSSKRIADNEANGGKQNVHLGCCSQDGSSTPGELSQTTLVKKNKWCWCDSRSRSEKSSRTETFQFFSTPASRVNPKKAMISMLCGNIQYVLFSGDKFTQLRVGFSLLVLQVKSSFYH